MNLLDIKSIGGDRQISKNLFKRTSTVDLEIEKLNIKIEIQSGFQGVNDIKQHKIIEARKNNFTTYVVHFDIYNGQIAVINTKEIKDDSIYWITRQQMEGQTVFNIDQNYFTHKLTDIPKSINL